MNYNQFSELPDDVFDGLGSLESLELYGNQISELPDDVFDSIISLRHLGLSRNEISELPDDVFDGLDSLTFLNLHSNQISVLPDDVFTGLDSLTQLLISYNRIAGLPEGVFDGLSQLYRLELNGNQLSELPEGVFDGLGSLLQLWLSNNPGAPFTFTAELEQRGDNVIKVKVAHGVPISMSVSLSAAGGNLSDDIATVAGGSAESDAITVTATGGGEVTVSVESADFVATHPHNFTGIQTGLGNPLTLGEYSDSNTPAAGAPTIRGTAQVGQTLTAGTADITDADGLTGATFSYQWLSSKDTEIVGATSFTYTLLAADEGKAMKVRVSFTDDQGNGESLTSAATDAVNASPNSPATGAPTIGGTVQVGERLTAGKSDIADADGLTKATFTYQWLADDTAIMGATDSTYTLAAADQGKAIKVEVSFTDDAGNDETLTSAATDAVDARPNSPATGAPTISGTVQVGQTLTADTSGIADTDGLDNVSFSYQWLSSRDTAISGATGLTYTLVSTDLGKTLKVRVSFTDDGGNEETLTTAPTAAVSAALPPPPNNVRAVTQESGAVELTWDAPDDATVTGYRIERRRPGADSSDQQRSDGRPRDNHTLVEDTGSADTGYTDESAEKGVEYEYRVSARNESGPGEASSWVRAGQASASNNPATGAPTIIGTAQVGETLTADTSGIADADGLSGETFTYQWVSSDGTTDTDITDIERATGSTLTLVAVDKGNSIKVRVTFTDDAGNEETLTSAPTGPVFGDGLPGAPRNLAATPGNKEITLSWDPPDDNGNAPATRYRIEWRVDGKDYEKNHWGTSRSTTYTTNDQANLANGVKYFFRVKAENDDGNSYGPYGPASGEVSATPTSGSAVDLGTPVLSDTETLHHGMVRLDWQDIEDAGWYVVQYYHVKSGEWLDLPAEGVDIAFHGSSAVVSNLHGLSWLRVRAMSCAGASEWSQIEQLFGTNASDWKGVPVPDVEEGDEIEPCPVVLGTPVLSDTETLHHGMVRLDWQDIEDAGWYVVQYYHVKSGEWLDLPAEGVDIAFHGSSAVVSNLHGLSWLRVRAMSCTGESEWSQIEQLFGTNKSDWEGVPVPEVAEGDEIEVCPEDGDTTDNSPATGAPTISGTAQVGETLTADTSGIADADGISNVQYEYQWLADDSEIAGATGWTYTVADSDEGNTIKIRVRFTDDAGNEETLTSGATDAVAAAPTPNSPATGAPAITGTAQVGETLTANTSGIADADGLDNAAFTYQWLADDEDISGATGSTYTLADDDEGKAIKVRVSFTDDAGNEEELTSGATDAVTAAPQPNSPATGAPTITGTAQVGEALTADTSGIADADGLENVSFSYEWLADDTAIQGATNSTYTLADADEGKTIKVRVSFTDDAGNEETLTSGEVGPVVSPQRIVVSPNCGQTVDFAVEAYDHEYVSLLLRKPNNLDITNFVLQRYEHDGAEFVSSGDVRRIEGELSSSLPSCSDLWWVDFIVEPNTLYKYTYELKDDSGSIVIETSLTVRTPPIPDSTGVADATLSDLTLSGIDFVPTLAAFYFVGPFLSDTVSYVGEAANSVTQTRVSPTLGHAGAGYVIMVDGVPDVDGVVPLSLGSSMVTVEVTADDDTTTRTYTITVTRTANTPATGAPTISGTAQVGETLTADTSGVADDDGLSDVQYEYQWLADDADIAGATNATYTLVAEDEGKAITVRVSFTDDADNEETLTSAATAAVAAKPNSPATGAPTITGTAQVGQTLTADTSGIADADGLTNVQHEYQWLADAADINGATGSTYTLADSEEGKAIKVEVSFTDDAGNEETLTSAATDAVAAEPQTNSPATGAPSISGTVQVGETLTGEHVGIADADGLSNVQYEYQSGATNARWRWQ